jgi:RNA polymerase sigma factor (TIGR02999 family)
MPHEPVHDPEDLAALVERWTRGDREAFDRLTEVLYDDLRAIAHRHLRTERPDHTLTTTALVHEAWVELSGRTGPAWRGRAQFFALLSRIMRNVLVDYARRRQADKRGGSDIRVPLDENAARVDAEVFELLRVNQALEQLEARDKRLAAVVECRFFGGMPEAQIAEALGVSARTVERDWRRARAYLYALLSPSGAPDAALPPERT